MTEKPDAVKRDRRGEVRLWGAPRPVPFEETREGKTLADSAPIHFSSKKDQRRLLAVEKVALDIFHDPLAARAFAVNPEVYLTQAGLGDVKLDLNSREIRIAMAMGDPVVRECARLGDVNGFVDAALAQGFEPDVSPLAVAAVELAVYVSAFLVSWVAAAYTLAAAVNVETALAVHHKIAGFVTAEFYTDELVRLADHLGDPNFARKVRAKRVQKIFDAYLELHKDSGLTIGRPEPSR